jgi:hypothetical protein
MMGVKVMKVVLDRFEGEYAICENEAEEMIKIEKCKLPAGVVEGDVLIVDGDNIIIDRDETQKRKVRIEKLMGELWE